MEHKELWGVEGDVQAGVDVPLGKASVLRQGGDLTIVTADAALLVFTRRHAHQTIVCACNMGGSAMAWQPPAGQWTVLDAVNGASLSLLPPYGAILAELVR